MRDSAARDVRTMAGMLLALVIPAVVTMTRIHAPPGAPPDSNPTPLGYTVSLLLFLVPVAVIGGRHLLRPRHSAERTALIAAGLTVTGLGFVLDILLGYTFFVFPNPGATLGVRLPAWSFADRAWLADYLPIEEFAFYILGALFMIVVYLWADVNWVSDYEPEQYANMAALERRIIDFTPVPLLICAGLLAAGFLYKRFGSHPYNAGFPGYFTFEMLLAFLPTAVFLRGVRDFINWRAFAFGYFMLLLLSLLWEATLGVPYGWWDYKPESMVGVRIMAWSNLPIEAVLLWLVAAWGAVVSFEFWRLWAHRRRTTPRPANRRATMDVGN